MLLSDDMPAAGFDQPYALLLGCHNRIERMDRLLTRLLAHVRQHGCNVEAKQAAAKVRRYFDLAAPLHHEDEELHVFPLLRSRGGAEFASLLDGLETDHQDLAALWPAIRQWLQEVEAGRAQAADPGVSDTAERFCAVHAAHIALENTRIFPAAQSLAGAAELAAMGRDMAARRGVEWPRAAGDGGGGGRDEKTAGATKIHLGPVAD